MGTSDSSQSKKSSGKGDKKGKPHFPNPFKSGKSPPPPPSPSPSSSSSSSEKKPSFKRNGSFGKGSVKAPTTPRRPMLATEARSLVRPCHCGKDGVFKPHSHNHDDHQRVAVTPERTIRDHKGSRSPQVTRKSRGVTPPITDHHHHQHKTPAPKKPVTKKPSVPSTPPVTVPSTPSTPSSSSTSSTPSLPSTPPPVENKTKEDEANKFVSTVVWYPELDPEFNATKVKLSPGDDATQCIDQILVKEYDSYIKKNFQNSDDQMNKLEEPIYTKHIRTNNLISGFESSFLQQAKETIS